jgi:hypothetical protein
MEGPVGAMHVSLLSKFNVEYIIFYNKSLWNSVKVLLESSPQARKV